MSDARQNKGVQSIHSKIPENIRAAVNINASSPLNHIASSGNDISGAKEKKSKSQVDIPDGVAISPLADKLTQNAAVKAVKKGNTLNHGIDRLPQEESGRQGVAIPQKIEKALEGALQTPESSSGVPLNKASSGMEWYWDQLIVRDAMLVLQERLGGTNATDSAASSLGNMSRLLLGSNNEIGDPGKITHLGVTPINSSDARLHKNGSNGAIEQLMRNYKEARAKGAQLRESTQQMMSIAMRTLGVDSGK